MPSRRDAHGRPPLTRSTRSWTDQDGTHYTVNSYSSNSGLSFGTMTGGSSEHFARNMSTAAPSRRTSMFGNAFSMLEDMVALQQQHRAMFEHDPAHQSGKPRRQDIRLHVDSETEGDDDGLAYDQYGHNRRERRKSVFSRIKERLLDGGRSPKSRYASSSSREESPDSSFRAGRKGAGHQVHAKERVPPRQSRRQSPVHVVVEHEGEESGSAASDARSWSPSTIEHNDLEALEDLIEHERRAVQSCKRRLEQASRQSNISSASLQRVIDEMKRHEFALADATEHLSKAKVKQRSRIPRTQPQFYHPGRSQRRQSDFTLEEHLFPTFAGFEFELQSPHSQHRNPMLGVYEQLNSFNHFQRPLSFGDFETHFEHHFANVPLSMAGDAPLHFSDMPGMHTRSFQRKKTRHNEDPPIHRQSHRVPTASSPRSPPSPQPPPSILRPTEAQQLFQSYDDRWNSLPPTDPAIPYPARGLLASSLSARDAIWAPQLKEGVSTWSEEAVMQANAQAFYLGVVGLTPRYTVSNGTGQIQCGIEKASASPEQIKQLVSILKKEKPRWHSDRLGRRNGGFVGAGPNETLQKDVRARAVFHAVCELMDRALE